jgi:hypothetical protein
MFNLIYMPENEINVNKRWEGSRKPQTTYVMCNIFHSILVSRHKFHSCIVHVRSNVNHKLIVHKVLPSILDCIDIVTTRRFHLVRNLNCKQLVNNRDQSNDDHRHKSPSPSRNVHGPNSLVSIDKLVDLSFHNLHPAILLYRNIDHSRNFHDQNNLDHYNQLLKINFIN